MTKKGLHHEALSRVDIENIVCDIIVQHTFVEEPEGGFQAEQGLATELGMDSIDILEVVLTCDNRFHIDISEDAVERLQTVGDICDVVEQLLYPDGNPRN